MHNKHVALTLVKAPIDHDKLKMGDKATASRGNTESRLEDVSKSCGDEIRNLLPEVRISSKPTRGSKDLSLLLSSVTSAGSANTDAAVAGDRSSLDMNNLTENSLKYLQKPQGADNMNMAIEIEVVKENDKHVRMHGRDESGEREFLEHHGEESARSSDMTAPGPRRGVSRTTSYQPRLPRHTNSLSDGPEKMASQQRSRRSRSTGPKGCATRSPPRQGVERTGSDDRERARPRRVKSMSDDEPEPGSPEAKQGSSKSSDLTETKQRSNTSHSINRCRRQRGDNDLNSEHSPMNPNRRGYRRAVNPDASPSRTTNEMQEISVATVPDSTAARRFREVKLSPSRKDEDLDKMAVIPMPSILTRGVSVDNPIIRREHLDIGGAEIRLQLQHASVPSREGDTNIRSSHRPRPRKLLDREVGSDPDFSPDEPRTRRRDISHSREVGSDPDLGPDDPRARRRDIRQNRPGEPERRRARRTHSGGSTSPERPRALTRGNSFNRKRPSCILRNQLASMVKHADERMREQQEEVERMRKKEQQLQKEDEELEVAKLEAETAVKTSKNNRLFKAGKLVSAISHTAKTAASVAKTTASAGVKVTASAATSTAKAAVHVVSEFGMSSHHSKNSVHSVPAEEVEGECRNRFHPAASMGDLAGGVLGGSSSSFEDTDEFANDFDDDVIID